MKSEYINDAGLPFCKGCGHAGIARNLESALMKLNISPLDVIAVTDIGCHGIIDKSLKTHTVHGLHGRSIALAAGISAGINDSSKKVIVFIGDGGITIGMQHLIDAAHHGFDMTVIIHNNMLYGMTGGQPSELTPKGFRTPTCPEGTKYHGYNICEIVTAAGASYVQRLNCIGDFSDDLVKAISVKGFSLLEIMEICPSYGVKSNQGMKLSNIVEDAGLETKVYTTHHRQMMIERRNTKSLFNEKDKIIVKHKSSLQQPLRISFCGSAGEGVQIAAEFLIKAAVLSGLNVTKKGNYPVTVGIGFSNAEIILSHKKILFTGSPNPDIMIITSQDGLTYGEKNAKQMNDGYIFIDSSLPNIDTNAKKIRSDFRLQFGHKNSILAAIFYFIIKTEIIPVQALIDVIKESNLAEKIPLDKMILYQ
ncbi:MAG: thiamine pyrophosphate-dependent enzyme [Bacteroidota bacterium]